MTKLIQEAVTEVANCGVMNLPTTWIFLRGSLMILAKAAYTASLYAMTPMMQATIREICREHKHVTTPVYHINCKNKVKYLITQKRTVAADSEYRAHLLVMGRYGSIS